MVYFVSQGNKVKIGFTNNIKQRMKNIKTSSPLSLKLLGTIDGDRNVEKELHLKFHQYKDNLFGEWFQWSDEIRDYINQNNQMDVWVDMVNNEIWIYKKIKVVK